RTLELKGHRRFPPAKQHEAECDQENVAAAQSLHSPCGAPRAATPPCHACSSTTSPSATGCSRPTCCPSKPDLPHTRAYLSERARSRCTSRARSSTVWPRRRVNGRSRSGGRPGVLL